MTFISGDISLVSCTSPNNLIMLLILILTTPSSFERPFKCLKTFTIRILYDNKKKSTLVKTYKQIFIK